MSGSIFSLDRLEKIYKLAPTGTFFRHDVDFSLGAALELAYLEKELGIKSTFYLFTLKDGECPFYSLEDALWASKQLLAAGHDVGRHVDERKTNISAHVLNSKNLRGKVSFHCPTEKVLWKDFPYITSAYASKWKENYVADSGGQFKYLQPEEILEKSALTGVPAQLNLHAEWWCEPGWYNQVSDSEYEDFFYTKKPNYVDSRGGRGVKSGGNAIWAFDPRQWSPHCALWVSPEDYDAVMERGYAVIDGQRAIPFLQGCDKSLGFLRLMFQNGPYELPGGRQVPKDVLLMPNV